MTPPPEAPSPENLRLAENLRKLRKATLIDGKPMTQAQLEAASGVKQAQVSKYETANVKPDLLTLLKLATGLNVELEKVVEGVDVKFDVAYRNIRASMTITADDEYEDEGTVAGEPPPMEQVLPGAPTEQGGRAHETTVKDLAEARQTLRRAAQDILSVTRFLPPEPLAVSRDLGSGVRQGVTRPRARTDKKSPAARRSRKKPDTKEKEG